MTPNHKIQVFLFHPGFQQLHQHQAPCPTDCAWVFMSSCDLQFNRVSILIHRSSASSYLIKPNFPWHTSTNTKLRHGHACKHEHTALKERKCLNTEPRIKVILRMCFNLPRAPGGWGLSLTTGRQDQIIWCSIKVYLMELLWESFRDLVLSGSLDPFRAHAAVGSLSIPLIEFKRIHNGYPAHLPCNNILIQRESTSN